MRRPLVSVIVTNFDRRRYLSRALSSVRRQTLRDRELIVVDGGSSDGSREYLEGVRGTVKLLLTGNPGPAALMNAGLREARGRLVAFLESDDYWLPRHLERLAAGFSDRRVQVASCGCRFVDGAGRLLNVLDGGGRMLREENALDPVFVRLTGASRPVLLSLTMMRASVFRKVGFFDPSFRWLASDMDLYYRIAKACGPAAFRTVDEVLAVRRSHPGQLTRLLLDVPRGRWISRRGLTGRQKESLLDMACFYRRHEGVIRRSLRARPRAAGDRR